jgi:hypothetical protein
MSVRAHGDNPVKAKPFYRETVLAQLFKKFNGISLPNSYPFL